jgi:hypothetical protein
MLAEEIAEQVSGGDPAVEAEVVAQLRRRAGLHT